MLPILEAGADVEGTPKVYLPLEQDHMLTSASARTDQLHDVPLHPVLDTQNRSKDTISTTFDSRSTLSCGRI